MMPNATWNLDFHSRKKPAVLLVPISDGFANCPPDISLWSQEKRECSDGARTQPVTLRLTCSKSLLDERQPIAATHQLDVAARQRAALACELDWELGRSPGAFRHLEPAQKGADTCGIRTAMLGSLPWVIRLKKGGVRRTSILRPLREAGDPPLYRLLLWIPVTGIILP